MAGDVFGCSDQWGPGGWCPMGRVRGAGKQCPGRSPHCVRRATVPAPALSLGGCSLGLPALLPGAAVCCGFDFRGFGAFGQAVSSPSAPATSQDLWPRDLQFSFIHQVPPPTPPPRGGLLLCWFLGNGHLAGEAGDPTDRCCHRAPTLSQGGHGSRGSVEPPGAVRGGFLEEVVPAPKPEGPRRSS